MQSHTRQAHNRSFKLPFPLEVTRGNSIDARQAGGNGTRNTYVILTLHRIYFSADAVQFISSKTLWSKLGHEPHYFSQDKNFSFLNIDEA